MVFGFIFDIPTLAITTGLPVYLVHKTLKCRSPAAGGNDLIPWLHYFSCLNLAIGVEWNFYWLLSWIPGYSLARFLAYVALLLPSPNGRSTIATWAYEGYLAPILTTYEKDIDGFIANVHDKLDSMGLNYVKQAFDWVRVKVGWEPSRPAPAQAPQSYADILLARFAGSLYGAASGAAGGNGGTSAPNTPPAFNVGQFVRDYLSGDRSATPGTRTPDEDEVSDEDRDYYSRHPKRE